MRAGKVKPKKIGRVTIATGSTMMLDSSGGERKALGECG